MKRYGQARWEGSGLTGKGVLNTPSTVLNDTPYSTKMRFEDESGKSGTNPEELIAAAHAGCFAMALSFQIVAAGFEADYLEVKAEMEIVRQDVNWTIQSTILHLNAKIPGISDELFQELALKAKIGCPVSQALNIEISLQAHLD